jgi:hypothetical protein
LTVAVNNCSCTNAGSSGNVSKKLSRSSSALSILSAYSPIIQIIDAWRKKDYLREHNMQEITKVVHRVIP